MTFYKNKSSSNEVLMSKMLENFFDQVYVNTFMENSKNKKIGIWTPS